MTKTKFNLVCCSMLLGLLALWVAEIGWRQPCHPPARREGVVDDPRLNAMLPELEAMSSGEKHPGDGSDPDASPMTPGVHPAGRTSPIKPAQTVDATMLPDRYATAQAYAFLSDPQCPPGWDLKTVRMTKNALMDSLVTRRSSDPGFARVLILMANEPGHDIVVRDYALQHLADIYAHSLPEARAPIQATLLQTIDNERDSSLAGTALLALHRITRDQPEVDPAIVAHRALDLAGDTSAGKLARIAAFQVCAGLRLEEALPVAEAVKASRPGGLLQRVASFTADQLARHGPGERAYAYDPQSKEPCHACP